MNNINPKTAREINIVLEYLNKEDYNKIPAKTINYLKSIEDKSYTTNIESIDDISENNLLDQTRYLLAYIFLNYLANEDEKKEFTTLLNENEDRSNKQYDIENIFKERQGKIQLQDNEEQSLVVIKKDGILKTILEKIKKLFNKNK